MILKQYYLGCLAHASYLLGDEARSTAIIVDPATGAGWANRRTASQAMPPVATSRITAPHAIAAL